MNRDFLEKADIARERLENLKILWIEGSSIHDVGTMLERLSQIGKFQLMDASLILNDEHVRFACFEALRSFETEENLTGSLAMEILVKAACTTQISEAIKRLGAKAGEIDLVLVAIDAGEDVIGSAIQLIGGKVSTEAIGKDPGGRTRIAQEYEIREPLEKNLLEKIALIATG
jgi:tRNA threonylcarbamoyladenosine modification (KEOPS) complex Cgi121 subunit